MAAWTAGSPTDIPDVGGTGGPAAYLRVSSAGPSRQGHVPRKSPFVHMKLTASRGAYRVLARRRTRCGHRGRRIRLEGSPEYAGGPWLLHGPHTGTCSCPAENDRTPADDIRAGSNPGERAARAQRRPASDGKDRLARPLSAAPVCRAS
jgi:hypothetical protein